MSINNFLIKENIATIWDVISDEEMFKLLSRDKQSKVVQVFEVNLNSFFNTEKTKSANLMDINKKYILLILKYIRDTFPSEPSKIKIHNESIKSLVTYEEIQNDRVTKFDRDLNARQQEFDNAIKIKPPPAPEFSDKFEDKPITDMESIIKEMTEKRNYEVANITKGQNNEASNNWLKPQETSIQNEKLSRTAMQNTNPNTNTNNTSVISNGNKLKYIKIDNDEISLNPSQVNSKKTVSWDQNLINEPSLEEISIFNKLKKTLPISDHDLQGSRIQILEEEVKNLNMKMDKILELLQTSNKTI
jgi:hypothetical protein